MEAAHGTDILLAALERATSFGRFRAHDVRSIIAAGTGVPRPAAPGEALIVELPARADAFTERLRHRRAVVGTAPPALPADIEAGLRRLRLRAMRSLSAELLVTAKTQRWKPEEFLRTLMEAEIASRDASNAANRLKAASFPVTKTLDEFDVAASSVKQATFDYLSSLEWVRAKENLCLVGPAGTGKSHLLVALGHAGHRSRLPGALLRRGRVGRNALSGPGRQLGRPRPRGDPQSRPDPDRRDRLRSDGSHRGPVFFRLVAAAYERRSLGVASHWPFEDWGRFLPDHSTAVSLLDRLLHHNVLVVTEGESFRMKKAHEGRKT